MLFSSPLFLIALTAVAVPVAVHLFNFRRYRKVYFSNVDRLQELQHDTRRQSHLRDLLVLVARCLAVVFLVLAFAQPVLPRKNQPVLQGGSAVSVYIDNSFSMENTDDDGSLLQLACAKAKELAAAYRPGDQFQLLTNAADGSQFRWLSREEFLLALDEVRPSPASVSLSSLARRQREFLLSARSDNRMAYVLSDFQRSTSDVEALPADSLVRFTLVPIRSDRVENLSVDSLWLDSPAPLLGAQLTVSVLLRNYGDENLEQVPVRLFLEGRERALAALDVPARGEATTTLTFSVDRTGALGGWVETADYPVSFDDRLFFALNVRSQMRVLELDGAGENMYLRGLFAEDSAVTFRAMPLRSFNPSLLEVSDLVVLNEVASVPSGLAQSLLSFAEAGGSLLVVPSAGADVESYNRMLTLFHAPTLGSLHKGRVKAQTADVEHPLFRGVFGKASTEDMELPSAERYWSLQRGASCVCQPVVSLANGDLFLSATPCQQGALYLLAAPLQPEYTDFVQQALFVPAVFNMALFARPLGCLYGAMMPGTAIPLASSTIGEVAHLVDDGDFDLIPDVRRQGGGYAMVYHGEPAEAGCYHLSSEGASECLALNYARRESDMETLPPAALQRLLSEGNLPYCDLVRHPQRSLEQYVRGRYQGRPLWRLCLVLCLLSLAAEQLLLRCGLPAKGKREEKSA